MGVKITCVRTKGFRDLTFACRELAELTGNDLQTVIDHEAAAVLQDTANNTLVAPPNKIMRDHSKQQWVTYEMPYGGSVAGREGYFANKAWARRSKNEKSGALKYKQSWRMPDWLWSEIRARRAQSLERKLKRAGLSSKHWYEQARLLGFQIAVPSRVKNAEEKRPLAVRAYRKATADDYAVQGQNFSQLSVKYAGGEKALLRAVGKRISIFQRAMKQFAEGKVHLVAKKYPDLLQVR